MSAVLKGKVKFFSEERSYGFIVPDDGSADIFVHRSGLSGSLDMLIPDQRVSYELVAGKVGKTKAVNVTVQIGRAHV